MDRSIVGATTGEKRFIVYSKIAAVPVERSYHNVAGDSVDLAAETDIPRSKLSTGTAAMAASGSEINHLTGGGGEYMHAGQKSDRNACRKRWLMAQ